MKSRWVPAPRYLLRKQCIMRMFGDLPPGRVLEIGCAQGDLLRSLAKLGHSGHGVDLSDEALVEARENTLAPYPDMNAGPVGSENSAGPFDYLISFEVLEHIEDDIDTLETWRSRLRPGGRLIMSVPAHESMWSELDVFAGHFRRYSRELLTERLSRAGFRVEKIWSYGYPIANLSHYANRRVAIRKMADWENKPIEERTTDSGIDRSYIRKFSFLWNNPLFRAVGTMQYLFLNTDWGNGYLVRAVAE